MTAPGQHYWLRLVTWMGLVKPTDGRPRSRCARVFLIEQDSSAREAAVGLAVMAFILTMLTLGLVGGHGWSRVTGGIALVLYGCGVVQQLVRWIRDRRATSRQVDPRSLQ